jgi:uncharacterized protein
MIKPVGASCNLACQYCYYLDVQDELYGGRVKRMGEDDLEAIFASWLPAAESDVIIAWQGGEPTLAGLGFFKRAVLLQHQYRRQGQRVANCLQTNGTLLNEDWCRFFAEHQFLIGISIDGAPADHDHYRVDPRNQPTYEKVIKGLDLLRRHRVEHNILCVINDRNVQTPTRVYRELLRLGERWLQFIPAIEWVDADTGQPHDGYNGTPGRPVLAPYSPDAEAMGRFYCEVFDAWFANDRDKVSVRFFDGVLSVLAGQQAVECTHGPACHSQVTIEHNGDVFGCDHYVQRRWQLGSVRALPVQPSLVPLTVGRSGEGLDAIASQWSTPAHHAMTAPTGEQARPLNGDGVSRGWFDSLDRGKLSTFADRKQFLSQQCRDCRWQRFCYGGCPKHRPHRGDQPEPTVLCKGYQRFFEHSMERFEWLAGYVRRGYSPPPPGHPKSWERRGTAATPVKEQRRPVKVRKRRR